MARPARKKISSASKAKSAKKMVQKARSAARKAVPKTKKISVKAVKKISAKPSKKTTGLAIGSKAPDFSMPATDLGTTSLANLKGKPFVLYFYPKDDTSGCTAEACEFRNNLSAFNRLGITIIGVSKDSMESHEKFKRKYSLTFPLASDENTKVCEAYGTWMTKSMYGRSYMGIERTTFLVDEKGIIRTIWRKVSVTGHIEEVKKAAQTL